MKPTSYMVLGAVAVAALGLTGCKKGGVVLRDPQVYKNEIAFLQMGLEQDTDLLRYHLEQGTCSCEDGEWTAVECEDTALNILVMEHRLQYHVDLMLYNAKMMEERPPVEPPEVPEPGSLCPGE